MIRIQIQGRLDCCWKEHFEEMQLAYDGGNTILSGNLKDESSLYGMINRIRDLNLRLLSLSYQRESITK